MSQSYSIRDPDRGNSAWAAGWHFLPSWTNTMGIRLGRSQGRQDLSALDDRLLEDIGISREEALWNAGKPFWRA
jgi:uncharacterized protein YjiS (DUF1127 family)